MIIGPLDLGAPSHPWAKPETGQVVGSILVEGYDTIVYPRGSIARKQTVSFWIKEWQAIGGQSANSQAAVKLLVRQLEELAGNRDYQPVLIQFNASADPAAILNATEYHDGWYVIDDFEPDYQNFVVSGLVQCRMTVTYVAPPPPRRIALWWSGGALSTNFSGGAIQLIHFPIGATPGESNNCSRIGAEGTLPGVNGATSNPEPFIPSSTLANLYKGDVHVYDTINTGSNPVPLTGLFVNANWVEVFGTDHDFQGDCVITNGFHLLVFQQGTANLCLAYLWSLGLSPIGWQQYATVQAYDNSGFSSTLQGYVLIRVGPEECAISCTSTNSSGTPWSTIRTVRLQRGRLDVRVDVKPLSAAATNDISVILKSPSQFKFTYNSGALQDAILGEVNNVVQTDYGYGAAFVASANNPYIFGFLWQNQPGDKQPYSSGNANLYIATGDTTSLAVNAQRSYGWFAVPYGVNGVFSTASLWAEGESGTLGTGWSSVADAAASGGNTAKAASGTASGNADTFGTARVWDTTYPLFDVWFRVRVTSTAGGSGEMTLGLWDSTNNIFTGSTTFAANQASTSYVWLRGTHNVNINSFTNLQRFRAVTAATLGTDWFIDEAVMVPTSASANAAPNMPQDIARQFQYDRGARWTRP